MEKTKNELIAEFMGWNFIPKSNNGLTNDHYENGHDWMDIGHMKYETSWEWLMPVVEKIQKLFDDAFPPGEEFVKRILAHEEPFEKEYMDVVGLPIGTPIQEVYQAVVTFIKWHNEK